MRTILPLLIALMFTAGCESCRREPAIVIRFEPIDAAGEATAAAKDLGGAKATTSADLGAAKAPEKAPAKKATACTKDADCVVETADCCGCAQGGKQLATHKQDKRTDAQKKKDCADTMCTQAISTDPSCAQKPACVKNECVLK